MRLHGAARCCLVLCCLVVSYSFALFSSPRTPLTNLIAVKKARCKHFCWNRGPLPQAGVALRCGACVSFFIGRPASTRKNERGRGVHRNIALVFLCHFNPHRQPHFNMRYRVGSLLVYNVNATHVSLQRVAPLHATPHPSSSSLPHAKPRAHSMEPK